MSIEVAESLLDDINFDDIIAEVVNDEEVISDGVAWVNIDSNDNDSNATPECNTIVRPKKKTLSLIDKKRIVNQAKNNDWSRKHLAWRYDISPAMIRRWEKMFDRIEISKQLDPDSKWVKRNSSKYKRFSGAGRKCSIPLETIQHLKKFLDDRRAEGFPVSVRLLMIELKTNNPTLCNTISRNALRMRISRLLEAWDFSWRRSTHKAQQTRSCSTIINDFQQYVNWKIRFLGIDPSCVFNADQTNVFYSMESNYTYHAKGSKSVPIKGVDSSSRLTVMLCANMVGEKIPPYLVFKGSTGRSARIVRELHTRVGYPNEVELAVHPRAWMDEAKVIDWIERVWVPFAIRNQPITYLILDEF